MRNKSNRVDIKIRKKVARKKGIKLKRDILLQREYRLKKKGDFQKIFQEGKSISTPFLVLQFKENDNEKTRIGFAVSKKIGSAVTRNKIKRRLREAIRPYLTIIKPKYDIIFIARVKIKGICFQDVEKNMVSLLMKAKIINRNDIT